MAIDLTLSAEPREAGSKGAARSLRRSGRIPATLYGARREPVSVSLNPKQVAAILQSESGHNSVFQLAVRGGETTAAMLVDWQREPIRGRLLHVDLKRIAMDQQVRVKVPVQVRGEAIGVKQQGGVLELVTREIEVECLPADIPEFIAVDVSELSIGNNLRVADVALQGNVRLRTEGDRVIAHVIAIKEEVVETPAAAAEAAATPAEPEVIKKGKAETEETAETGKEKDGEKEEKEKKSKK